MSESLRAKPQASGLPSPQRRRPREGVSQGCWICSYLSDRLAADSGASPSPEEGERDRVLGERQRHRDMMHPGRDYQS